MRYWTYLEEDIDINGRDIVFATPETWVGTPMLRMSDGCLINPETDENGYYYQEAVNRYFPVYDENDEIATDRLGRELYQRVTY